MTLLTKLLLGVWLGLLVLIVLALADPAAARDDGRWADQPMSDWFKAQKNQDGAYCCDDADGHPTEDWGHGPDGRYWVVFDGVKHVVPARAVVSGANPYGAAIVWIYPVGSNVVRCFMPGVEG